MSFLSSAASSTKSTTKRNATASKNSSVDKVLSTLKNVGSKGLSNTVSTLLANSEAGALTNFANELTSSGNSIKNKETITTFWTNLTEKDLATVDAYKTGVAGTINSIYEFENTISFDSIISGLTGGVDLFNKAKNFVSQAKDVAESIKNGDILSRLGNLSGSVKGALNEMGVSGFDGILDSVNDISTFVVKTKDTYHALKEGDLTSIGLVGDLINSVLGVDVINVKDISAMATAITTTINSMSDIGLSILNDIDSIFDIFKDSNGEYIDGYEETKLEIAKSVLDTLIKNGDVISINNLASIVGIENLLSLKPDIVDKLISSYNFDSNFISQVASVEDFNEMIAIFKLLLGEDWLYVDRNRTDKAININKFLNSSSDWETALIRNITIGNYDKVESKDLDMLLLSKLFDTVDVKAQIKNDFPKTVLAWDMNETKELNSPDIVFG